MDELEIKEANKSDIKILKDMMISLQELEENANSYVWRITDDGENSLKKEIGGRIEEEDSRILVAQKDGEILGFVSGEVKQQKEYKPKRYGFISSLFVEKEYRRKGIGTRLVKELVKFFKTKDVEEITMRYVVGNEGGEKFWKKLGFEEVKTTANQRNLDEILQD